MTAFWGQSSRHRATKSISPGQHALSRRCGSFVAGNSEQTRAIISFCSTSRPTNGSSSQINHRSSIHNRPWPLSFPLRCPRGRNVVDSFHVVSPASMQFSFLQPQYANSKFVTSSASLRGLGAGAPRPTLKGPPQYIISS